MGTLGLHSAQGGPLLLGLTHPCAWPLAFSRGWDKSGALSFPFFWQGTMSLRVSSAQSVKWPLLPRARRAGRRPLSWGHPSMRWQRHAVALAHGSA